MNRLFDDAFGGDLATPFGTPEQVRALLSPRLDVNETDQEIRLSIELPGVSDKDIDVSLDDDILTVRAEKKAERTEEPGKEPGRAHITERAYGMFQRALRLPFRVEPDGVTASFNNGVLTITVRKPQQQEQKRRIEVQSASQQASPAEASGKSTSDAPTQPAAA
jgi:HSP20 family protein